MSKTESEIEPVEFVRWDEFAGPDGLFDWQQGEHVTILGPTNGGKTYLALHLLPRRQYVVVLATKPRDSTLDALQSKGFERIAKWPPPEKGDSGSPVNRVLLWPAIDEIAQLRSQREVFQDAMHQIYKDGAWCVFADELFYLVDSQFLGLRREVAMFLGQGRSLQISLVTATQRPKGIPLLAYDQATHLFFFRDNDYENLKRYGEIQNIKKKTVIDAVQNLGKHQVLYLNTRTGVILRTKVS